MSTLLVNLLLSTILLSGCGQKSDKKEPTKPTGDDLTTSVAGATFSKNSVFQVKLDWETGPVNEDPSAVRISIYDTDGKFSDNITGFSFLPFMTVHGHPGSTKMMTLETESPGIYIVRDFYFTMAGSWDLIIKASIGGTDDEVVIGVEVP